MQYWLYLRAAIVPEVAGTTSMKLPDGLSRMTPTIPVFVFYAASFAAFSIVPKKIDVSVANAIWAGIGTAAIAVIGIAYFRESIAALKLISIAFIIIGVVGLNLGGVKQ